MRKRDKRLMHLITAGFVLSAGAQTVLIDYNDGVANGVHEASVLNGSFDAPSTPAKFGEMADWYCLLPNAAGTYDYQVTAAGNTPRTGSTAAFLSTDQGGAAGVNPAVFGSTTGYTIQEGDQFAGSYWWRNMYQAEVTDHIQVTLFYRDDDTLGPTTEIDGSTHTIETFESGDHPGSGNYEQETFTSGVIGAGHPAIGRTLMVRFTALFDKDGGATEYARVDDFHLQTLDGEPLSVIISFSAEPAQRPDPVVLSWSVTGAVSSLEIDQGVGDVTGLTTSGSGAVAVYPTGVETYTLTLNGTTSKEVKAVGLPEKEKLHIYLLIGQSNMAGYGAPFDSLLDAPDPRILKFGSMNGMEQVFEEGAHNLTQLGSSTSVVGMGLEFAKTMLASQSDTNVVICLINHAKGASAIQWWAPGVVDNKQVNPVTGLNYYLYDEAVQRVHDAETYGVLKGVLWHQGEYNSNNNTNPDSEPALYAGRVQALVDNLRSEFTNSALPFICGKFVPASWVDDGEVTNYFTGLPNRSIVEAALEDLPNHRSNTFCVDNNGLRGNTGDLIHFDAYSQRLLGQRYAAAMITFYSEPFLHYMGGYLTPAEMADPNLTDPLADNDGDGRVNYLEYALRFNPMVADYSAPMTIAVPGPTPQVSFNKRTDTEAPVYRIDLSTNLVDWLSNAVVEAAGSPFDNGDGSATVTVEPLTNVSSAFFRLKVGPR